MSHQPIEMRSPKGGVYKVLPSKIQARIDDGWYIVNPEERARHSAYVARMNSIKQAQVVHGD